MLTQPFKVVHLDEPLGDVILPVDTRIEDLEFGLTQIEARYEALLAWANQVTGYLDASSGVVPVPPEA